ncbi:putative glycosyl transferase, family 4, phospho-N-acetylmuramoyl-pentapeptide transferase [Dioscorea sansibarensis]
MNPFIRSISNSIPSAPNPLSMSSSLPLFLRLAPLRQTLRSTIRNHTRAPAYSWFSKSSVLCIDRRGCTSSGFPIRVSAMDDDPMDVYSIFDENDVVSGRNSSFIMSSSEGEDSDSDPFLDPNRDVDLPPRKDQKDIPDAALTVAAHRFASINRGRRKRRIRRGVWNNMGLIAFVVLFLLFVDWCSWRIVRIPLEPFYLTYPFWVSASLSACAGWIYIPLVDSMKLHQIQGKGGPSAPSSKRGIPTMGGLFFIPVGVIVARCKAGSHSYPVYGSLLATLACAAVGLLDDGLSLLKNRSYGLSGWTKFFLLVVVGATFSAWMNSANLPTPYNMYTYL